MTAYDYKIIVKTNRAYHFLVYGVCDDKTTYLGTFSSVTSAQSSHPDAFVKRITGHTLI